MKLVKGTIVTGKWFTGKVEVIEVKEASNKLEVKLQHNVEDTEEDYHWFETWNLSHTRVGFGNKDYFNILLTQK